MINYLDFISMLPPEIWAKILHFNFFDVMKQKLLALGIDYQKMCTFLREQRAIISGSFIISCLRDDDHYSDLDVYYSLCEEKDKKPRNLYNEFNKVYVGQIPSGRYFKSPVCIPVNVPMINYITTIGLTCDKNIDLVGTPILSKSFVQTHGDNIDIFASWFDGNIVHFNFDPLSFIMRSPVATILQVGSIHFETYYNPWIGWDGANKTVFTVGYHDSGMDQGTGKKTKQCQDLMDRICKLFTWRQSKYADLLPNNISHDWDKLCAHVRKSYVGQEDVTDYRLVKLAYRIVKYSSRGIMFSNVSEFFQHTNKIK